MSILCPSQFGSNLALFLTGFDFAEFGSACALLSVVLLVDAHNAGSSESQVVLQGVFEIGDLSLASDASQLPAELSALGKACSSEGVSLADETARWIHDNSTAVGIVALIDEFSSFSLLA